VTNEDRLMKNEKLMTFLSININYLRKSLLLEPTFSFYGNLNKFF